MAQQTYQITGWNDRIHARHSGQSAILASGAHPKKGVGFPIARMVGVFSLSTGALLDLAIAPWSGKGTGEHALLRQLLQVFATGDIMIADRYYASYFLIATLMQMGVDVVTPQHASRDSNFLTGKKFSNGDHLVEWKKPVKPGWMSEDEYTQFPAKITVRETRVTLHNPGFRDKTMVLVTTLVDARDVTVEDLCELYGFRWFVELALRSVKEVMRMGILRGKTPTMVKKEIWAHVLAYNLVRKLMLQAAISYRQNPRTMSFKLALQMISAFRQAECLSGCKQEVYKALLKALASKKTGQQNRPSQPRVVKRRPKAFPRMQQPRAKYLEIQAVALLS